jgi:hypothetical protein
MHKRQQIPPKCGNYTSHCSVINERMTFHFLCHENLNVDQNNICFLFFFPLISHRILECVYSGRKILIIHLTDDIYRSLIVVF